jgi:hypothetical protein
MPHLDNFFCNLWSICVVPYAALSCTHHNQAPSKHCDPTGSAGALAATVPPRRTKSEDHVAHVPAHIASFGRSPSAETVSGQRLRWHLLTFAAALLLPVLAFAAFISLAYGVSEQARLEGEARAAAFELEAAVDRELSALLAAAQTLAASPALRAPELADFQRQAFEVAAARGVVVVVARRPAANSSTPPRPPAPSFRNARRRATTRRPAAPSPAAPSSSPTCSPAD